MNFLQPWMLAAIPAIGIPILIHFLNQRRFQTVPWAAMRFLLEANQMSSGFSRLKQWLILALRTLALALLIFFTARPLASGLLASIGGANPGVAIIVLDRSPSMASQTDAGGTSQLDAGIDRLANTLRTVGVQRIVQFGGRGQSVPEEFASVDEWLRSVPHDAWSATTDIPGLLESALSYVKNNPANHTVVWLCSDLRESDWRSRDGRWAALRDGFQSLAPTVSLAILDTRSPNSENRSVRVTEARWIQEEGSESLSLSFRIEQTARDRTATAPQEDATGSGEGPSVGTTIPVEISVGMSRFAIDVDRASEQVVISDYRIPIEPIEDGLEERSSGRRWGWVRIPGDRNPADDISYFVVERPPPRRTVIVSQTPELIEAIELSASIAPQQSLRSETERITTSQLESIDWEGLAMIVWQERLPSGRARELLEKFVASGGELLLVPPESPDDTQAFGMRWLGWESVPGTAGAESASTGEVPSLARIAQWQNDSQLLANTLNGAALPLGQLGVRRYCRVEGNLEPLASLPDGQPILARLALAETTIPSAGLEAPEAPSSSGITVCTTTPSNRDSTMAGDGVVLYVAIQRLLSAGAERAGTVRRVVAGLDKVWGESTPTLLAGEELAPTTEYAVQAGVYEFDGLLYAVERGTTEDRPLVVTDESLRQLLEGLSWAKAEAAAERGGLAQEVGRWFTLLVLVALLAESAVSLPRRRVRPTVPSRS